LASGESEPASRQGRRRQGRQARPARQGFWTSYALEGWLACGPPAAVLDKIRAYVDAGCTTPILRFASWDQKGQLVRALAEVMPAALGLTVPA
jgi:hypothetical protein